MADFDKAVALVLAHEGGYVPASAGDPGGETNFGISKRAYPQLDIVGLTRDDAIEIYRRDYWREWMDSEPCQQLANCLLDCAVNQGVNVASALYRPPMALRDFQVARLTKYALLYKPQYLHSWFSRVLDV